MSLNIKQKNKMWIVEVKEVLAFKDSKTMNEVLAKVVKIKEEHAQLHKLEKDMMKEAFENGMGKLNKVMGGLK